MWGIASDKLYSSWMVYSGECTQGNACSHEIKALGVDQGYYFTIEAFNQNGIARTVPLVEVK